MGSRIRPIFRAHVEGVAPGSFLSRSVSMSDQPSLQGPGPSRKFLPEVKPLESRLLLSRQVSFPDGTSFIFPTFTPSSPDRRRLRAEWNGPGHRRRPADDQHRAGDR